MRATLSDLIIESELDDGDLRDFIDYLKDMLPEEDVEEDDEDECDCHCELIDCDFEEGPKFPCRITCSDDDDDPIDIELSLEALNVILDKTNKDGCSFNDAFCCILTEYLDIVTSELDHEDDKNIESEEKSFGF